MFERFPNALRYPYDDGRGLLRSSLLPKMPNILTEKELISKYSGQQVDFTDVPDIRYLA